MTSRRAARSAGDDTTAWVLLLIAGTMLVRISMAAALGLGMDETYVVAAGREPQLGYFDHPPAVWWLSWAGAHLGAGSAPVAVRLPFIALFAGSTWLTYRLGTVLFSRRAGLWAAVAMNLSPVIGLTAASWVLPDGPLFFSLIAFALCLVIALRTGPTNLRGAPWEISAEQWLPWLGAGLFAGFALLSKYNAVLVLAGAVVGVLTQPSFRVWLRRPHPYVAALLALAVFAPVIWWNAGHGWASFAFQAGRAGGGALHPLGPLLVLGGESVFLLPWIWFFLMVCLAAALRRGPAGRDSWLMACMALPPIILFAAVALWSRQRVLFHWAAAGYLMLFPLLGNEIATWIGRRPWVSKTLAATSGLILVALAVVSFEYNSAWASRQVSHLGFRQDPNLEAVPWTGLRTALAQRGMLDWKGLAVGTLNWRDAGKADYALDGALPVICLCDDSREYGFKNPTERFRGHDILIVTPSDRLDRIDDSVKNRFEEILPLEPVTITHNGQPVLELAVIAGWQLR